MARYHIATCPVNAIVQPLRSKWIFPLLVELSRKPATFLKLKKALSPITSKSLAACMDKMISKEFVAHSGRTYTLTPSGKHLLSGLKGLVGHCEECRQCPGEIICNAVNTS